MGMDVLLGVENLKLIFETYYGKVRALNGVSLDIKRKEVIGLVGESGCGKTVLGLSIIGLLPMPPGEILDGEIFFQGKNLLELSDKEMDEIRGTGISMIFQEPMTSLNPVFTIGDQVIESVKIKERTIHYHKNIIDKLYNHRKTRWRLKNEVREALTLVRISDPKDIIKNYPHELSGGMRQRVMIAMALAAKPSLMIADEPTTALDVTTQAQVLKLMRELMEEVNTSILFISHDFGVIAEIADRVAVMYAGNIVEEADVYELFENPIHPYTRALLSSLPSIASEKKVLEAIPGEVPSLISLPQGCPFQPRCKYVRKVCSEVSPKLKGVTVNHKVACHVY